MLAVPGSAAVVAKRDRRPVALNPIFLSDFVINRDKCQRAAWSSQRLQASVTGLTS